MPLFSTPGTRRRREDSFGNSLQSKEFGSGVRWDGPAEKWVAREASIVPRSYRDHVHYLGTLREARDSERPTGAPRSQFGCLWPLMMA